MPVADAARFASLVTDHLRTERQNIKVKFAGRITDSADTAKPAFNLKKMIKQLMRAVVCVQARSPH